MYLGLNKTSNIIIIITSLGQVALASLGAIFIYFCEAPTKLYIIIIIKEGAAEVHCFTMPDVLCFLLSCAYALK